MVANPGCVVCSENLASLLAVAWPQSATPVNIMSGFCKCGIHPLNPGVIDDRQTAPSQAVSGAAQSELQAPTSPSSSTGSTAGSTPISALTLDCGIMVHSSRRGVNHDAVCITDAEFIDQLKSKELEKKKQQEEAEQKRI